MLNLHHNVDIQGSFTSMKFVPFYQKSCFISLDSLVLSGGVKAHSNAGVDQTITNWCTWKQSLVLLPREPCCSLLRRLEVEQSTVHHANRRLNTYIQMWKTLSVEKSG